MDVEIYQDREMTPEKLLARIDENGKIYSIGEGGEEYLGWIDYKEGDIYNHEDILLGWVEEGGEIITYDDDEEEEYEIGYVTEQGDIYYYSENEKDAYLCSLKNMQDYAEGAAALLFSVEGVEEEDDS